MHQYNVKIFQVIFLFSVSLVNEASSLSKDLVTNIGLSSGYNSNVFYRGDADINNDVIEESDIQHSFILNAGYKYFSGVNSDAKLYVDYFYDKLQNNGINYSTIDLSLPYTFYTKNFRIRFTPLISSFSSSGTNAMQYFGTSVNATRKLGFYRAGINILLIKNKVVDEIYSAYEGSSNNSYVFLERRSFSTRFDFKLGSANYHYQQTIDGDESYSVYYVGGSYIYFKGKKEISLAGRWQSKKYIDDPFDGFKRLDHNTKFSITPAYRVSKSVKFFVKVQYLVNSSNLSSDVDDKNYDQSLLNIGVNWRL